ncbi:terpene cyclase/mutase family protein [Methanococcoides sp. SA1]|nr:terpene cyclase/mutase family protein [Methanococcoides sp. SA1]
MEEMIQNAFEWIREQEVSNAKELSRLITAFELWGVENDYSTNLIQFKSENNWDNSIRETARACSSLVSSNLDLEKCREWLLSKRDDNGSWGNDVYDTTYALIALAEMGIHEMKGCKWLVENYGEKWEHVGTTSLIITTLVKQETLTNDKHFTVFIEERARWILSKRAEDGGWKFISTSNLVIQALVIVGLKEELKQSFNWLISRQNSNGSWGKKEGDIAATALSLITLGYAHK